MPFHTIPAPGFTRISGHRSPPKSWGEKLLCQIRNGWVDPQPWPVATTRWKYEMSQQTKGSN